MAAVGRRQIRRTGMRIFGGSAVRMTAMRGQGFMISKTMSPRKGVTVTVRGLTARRSSIAAPAVRTSRPAAEDDEASRSPRPPTGPTEAVVRHLGSLVGWARLRSFDQIQARSGVDVDRSGIVILATLHRLGPLRLSDLAADIGLDRSTISRQVAAVVRDGYVQKVEDLADARASLLTLTPRGQAARRKLADAWGDIVRELLADWTPEEQGQLGRLLGRLATQVRPGAP
jgi:DNA-binding MarR family transcriptional regulator